MKKLIIILAHPRTGSSLLMQTLRLLNIGIVGEPERKDLPFQANPKGYYEDKNILSNGLTSQAIEEIEQNESEIVAVKISLKGMTGDNRANQWQYLQKKYATIVVPIRPPLESALSNLVFARNRHDEIIRFRQITTFLRNYQIHYKKLSEIFVKRIPELLPDTFTIDYFMAQSDPPKYVQRIIDKAGLRVSQSQFNDALNNIDPELYRFNQHSFEDRVKKWNHKIGTDRFYDILSTEKNPWQIINDFSNGVSVQGLEQRY